MAKIIGNITATPNPRPDWLQTDSSKADYIKNKPVAATEINENSTNGEYAGAKAVYDLVSNFAGNGTNVEYSTDPNIWELDKGWHYISQGFYLNESDYFDIAGSILIYKTYPANVSCVFYGLGNVYSNQINLIYGTILSVNGWQCTCNVERFTEEINAESPLNHNYPSEKAVVDFVKEQINSLIGTAPEALDTLAELSAALNDNPDILDLLATKEDLDNIDTKIEEIANNQINDLISDAMTEEGKSGEKVELPTSKAVQIELDIVNTKIEEISKNQLNDLLSDEITEEGRMGTKIEVPTSKAIQSELDIVNAKIEDVFEYTNEHLGDISDMITDKMTEEGLDGTNKVELPTARAINDYVEDKLANYITDAVPNTRTINGKVLSEDIIIDYSDVGADQSGTAQTKANEALQSAKEYTDTAVNGLATKAYVDEVANTKADSKHNHDEDYDVKGSAATSLNEAKTYTDNVAAQKSQVQIIIWEADD